MISIQKFLCKMKHNKYRRQNIYVTEPSMVYISPKANLNIGILRFNRQWDEVREKNNIMGGQLNILENSYIEIGNADFLSGCRLTVENGARFVFKSGYVNYESVIACFCDIEIGHNVFISERVQIRDSNNHRILREDYIEKAPIVIGDNVWIGMGAIILPGVKIGNGAVIAAGAVVTKDVPEKTLAGGCPARILRENVEWR